MPNFRYKIRDKYGRASTGTIEGESREAVAVHFKKMGYVLTSIQEQKPGLEKLNILEKILGRRVALSEMIVFTRQLMTLQKAGVPILVSLESVREQTSNKYFRKVISEIIHDVEAGKSLSASMTKFPNIFSRIYVNMIRSGEAAGILESVLDRLSSLLEHEEDVRMKVKQATRYPLLVIMTIALAFPVVIMFIIPKFTSLFSSLGADLPLPTRILIKFNFILTNYWALILGAVFLAVFSCRYAVSTNAGRRIWDSIKLKLPVFGVLNLKISMSRFSRMMATLISTGIPIINVLETVRGAIGNVIIASSVDNIIRGVEEGKGITAPMKASGLFPVIVIQMVKIGEETGRIDDLLMRVSDYYDSQIDYTVKNLSVLIEPILIFVIGMMVLLLAVSIFLPLWSLISIFRH